MDDPRASDTHCLAVIPAFISKTTLTPFGRRTLLTIRRIACLLSQTSRDFLRAVPELVAEVVSPSQTSNEVYDKAQMWLYNGVSIVWVVWPETRMVDVYRQGEVTVTLREGDTLTADDVVPSFSCAVDDIFADIPTE